MAPSSAARAYPAADGPDLEPRALAARRRRSRGIGGGILSNGSVVRLLHASTGLYLCVRPRRGAAASAPRCLRRAVSAARRTRRRQRWRRRRRRRVGRVCRRVRGECCRRVCRDWRGGDGVAAAAAEALGALVLTFRSRMSSSPRASAAPNRDRGLWTPPRTLPPAPTPTRAPPDTPPRAPRQIRRHLRGVDAWLAGGGASTPRGAEPTAAGWRVAAAGVSGVPHGGDVASSSSRPNGSRGTAPTIGRSNPPAGCLSTAPGRARAPSHSSLSTSK